MDLGTRHRWFQLAWILMLLPNTEGQRVRCDMPADVVFLLDASASIKHTEWEQEKDFVGILIDSLAVERHAINVGLIVYSTEIGQVVDLQPFKTRAQLKSRLPQLVQTSQGTDTARAINRMRQMMQNQARDNAKKIAIVITDGRSENSTATIQEAVYARQLDRIMMIALGVGNETYIDELQEVAKSDFYPGQNRLFTVRDFAQLQGVVEGLRTLICESVPEDTTTTTTTTTTTMSTTPIITPDLPPISCPRPADVVFLLDGSHSITDSDWARGRVFVSTLVNSLEIDIDAIHAGIIVYSSDIGDTVPLKPFLDKTTLKRKASGLNQPPLGRTNTALGLRALRSMFAALGRPNVPHIGIVITDGKSSNVQATMDEALLAKTVDGVVMVVVGVGLDTLATELDAMATSPATLFNVTGFSALFDIAAALRERICIASETTTSPISTTPRLPNIPSMCQECLVKGGVGYNTYPPDCTKYVVCYPQEDGGYQAEIKSCPFGLFWSSQAVSCVDATYVNCTSDPCRGQPEGWGHTGGTQGCGEYWLCREGRSRPHCCPQGQRYSSVIGCFRDASCQDRCSLQFTVAGNGACPYRPNPSDPFSYMQVMPGYGQVKNPCSPGTVYSHNQCACVFYTPALGCVPSLHYDFDGTFNDKSTHSHPAHIHRVLLTKHGSAYFNGSGHVRVNTLPSNEFKDNFVLRLRYRVQPERPADIQWNDHYKWGLQDWFTTNTNPNKNFTFTGGQLPNTGPEPGLPSGQQTSTLEEVVILRNGTVVHGNKGTPGGGWDVTGSFESRLNLGPMSEIGDTAVSGGVVYVPNNKGQVLVLTPKTAPQDSAKWQIVSKDGTVVKSGTGQVPPATATSFSFKMRPDPATRWFIMTSTGTVLNSGTGVIPDSVKNLYAGFSSGKLVKVDQIGDEVVEWSVSRPDGTGASGGKGQVPANLRQQLKLDQVLRPQGANVQRWAVLSAAGDVMESGTGDVPADVMRKYAWLRSGLVLIDSDTHWQLKRTDGTLLQEGSGNLSPGVSQFIQGSLVLPSLVQTSTWTVTLPNGTTLTGKGAVPDHIQKLFEQGVSSGGGGGPTQQTSRWYVTDGKGKVLESGYGDVPQNVVQRHRGRVDTRVVQQSLPRGSNTARWEVRGQDGSVLASGNGQPPADIFKVVKGQQKTSILVPGTNSGTITSGANAFPTFNIAADTGSQRGAASNTGGGGTITSGSNYPGRGVSTGTGTSSGAGTGSGSGLGSGFGLGLSSGSGGPTQGIAGIGTSGQTQGSGGIGTGSQSQSSGGAASTQMGGQGQRRWTVTLPDGSQRSGVGEMPADLRALLSGKDVQTTRRWTVTLPDGSTKSGTGEVPADIKALLASQGSGRGLAGGQTKRTWTVTMPDGSTRSGEGEVPADIKALLANQGGSTGGGQTKRTWTVTMPDGSTRSGEGEVPADIKVLLANQGGSTGGQTERTWTVTMPDGSTRSGEGEVPADIKALLANQGGSTRGQTKRTWTVTMPDGSTRSGEGEVPADIKALLANQGGSAATSMGGPSKRIWSVTMPDGTTRSGEGEVPADIKALLANQPSPQGTARQIGGRRLIRARPRVEALRRWSVTMPNGTERSGTGDIPADIQALLDAQAQKSGGGGGGGGGRVGAARVSRQWTITMPNGTVRTGTGDIPADLKALLAAQRASGRKRRWSVTLPDGSKRSGVGEIPGEVQRLMAEVGQGRPRRWRVRMSDGTTRAGRGAIPTELTTLMEASPAAAFGTKSRRRRAAGEQYQDVLGNCGTPEGPTFLLVTSQNDVKLTLKTTKQRRGVTLALPISPGMNDVEFVFDGKTLSGFSNGVQKSLPLQGSVLPVQAPVMIGTCRNNFPTFRGEIDDVSISSCIS
ncbi:uncharacterized protein [Littorina saxatilis]|uniref:uncharacterized protein n=1 Tax=Littorina saxatilis TaxID=31220 RepID=UPI0038B50E1F